jgi:hypothetical protein
MLGNRPAVVMSPKSRFAVEVHYAICDGCSDVRNAPAVVNTGAPIPNTADAPPRGSAGTEGRHRDHVGAQRAGA